VWTLSRLASVRRHLGSSALRMTGKRARPSEEAHDILAAEEFGVPAPDPSIHADEAHDVLAAEEFGMPAPSSGLHADEAHDVLAAEEFGMPTRDPALRHGPVDLPSDPTGIVEPHDVLAAEEFAMPSVPVTHEYVGAVERGGWRTALGVVTALAVVALVLRRKRFT
jgi:hypothetical protein